MRARRPERGAPQAVRTARLSRCWRVWHDGPPQTDGTRAEALAAEHLLARGWVIVARNWRRREARWSIVARDGPSLVFVKVRSRGSGTRSGSPEESVGAVKRHPAAADGRALPAGPPLGQTLPHRWWRWCWTRRGGLLRLAHYPDVA
ncbi:MAG: YraN family protein [Ardenticatenia bacterium]|nr:YraN family protein [Ardenticatenia bacterium]